MTETNLPKHIAIIMDGNGRWAKKRFLPRVAGHAAGVETVRRVVQTCVNKKIKVLTLFSFSSENWRRPASEVNFLMDLFLSKLTEEISHFIKENIQVRFIGERAHFDEKLRNKISEVERLTENNTGLVLIFAADYGGQWDIVQSVQKLAQEIEAGRLTSAEISPDKIAANLSFSDLPDPDLFIRTSGEIRISNFMLWQLAYAELYFTPVLWPDFDENELLKALDHYANRERRFGLSGDQLRESTCSNNG